MALISQTDVHTYDDFDNFGSLDAYSAVPSIGSLDSSVDERDPLEDVAPVSDLPQKRPPLPLRLRRPVISPSIWESFKPVIQDLYVCQQLSLEDVRQRMKEQHNFDATEQMYKKRLRDWGVRKNYTQLQKLEAIKQLREGPSEACGGLPLQLNGVPLKKRRLWRPVMQKRQRVILAPRPCSDPSTHPQRRLGHPPSPQRLQLRLGRETQAIESLLRYAQSYHSWYQAQNQIKVHYGYTPQLHKVFDGLRNAVVLLHRDHSTAFCLINQCCSDFNALLQAQPFKLIPHIFIMLEWRRFLGRKNWRILESVLKFFASLANTTLGTSHPIANLATILLNIDEEHIASCLERYAELLLDQTKTIRDGGDSAQVQLAIIDVFDAAGQLDIASGLCQRLWDAVQSNSSALAPAYPRILETVVHLSIRRGDYSAAEQLLMQPINASVVATGKQNGCTRGFIACRHLGQMYFVMVRPAESEKFYRLAIEGALQRGFQVPALSYLTELEHALWNLGKEQELARLRIEYQHIWAQLDEWRLDRDIQGQANLLSSVK